MYVINVSTPSIASSDLSSQDCEGQICIRTVNSMRRLESNTEHSLAPCNHCLCLYDHDFIPCLYDSLPNLYVNVTFRGNSTSSSGRGVTPIVLTFAVINCVREEGEGPSSSIGLQAHTCQQP